ncbi:caspase family protein [Pedobacter sandarakinus]|uniref:caspase family protein n=1 Tax=Pedobacter sandarakinus TaxID=353156 RepID=UPI002246C8DB|nr:caspase family protein [Pedobacter sandarakinus]MCX2573950.1 caspase family protein [Pedobacter sandarakinus]
MRKLFAIIILLEICFPTIHFAQSKYAILVGVNDYYSKPGQKSEYSLKGCVNDAMSMRTLLSRRFDFDDKNINLILNEKASQQNLIDAFATTLNKSKSGDVVVFYFSGHGIYIDNFEINNDPVKKGYNQSLVLSDLYSPGYNCLMKDNTLKKIFNQFVAKKVIFTAIFDCCYSGNISMTTTIDLMQHNPYFDGNVPDSGSTKSIPFFALESEDKAVNLSVMPVIPDKEIVPRPSDTKNSYFASISACKDDEKAKEIWDESGVPHGALTRTILSMFEKTETDIVFLSLLNGISTEINGFQLFKQKPIFHNDANRNNRNLIGLPLANKINKQPLYCVDGKAQTITLGAGYLSGIANGNRLVNANKSATADVISVYPDSAIAKINPATKIKKGDVFSLQDSYRSSNPILKLYIETTHLNTIEFLKNITNEIVPISTEKNYVDYFNWYNDLQSPTFGFNNTLGEGKRILSNANNRRFAVLLPIPKDLAQQIKKFFMPNQNIVFVQSIKEADRVIYLNYVTNAIKKERPCFVITFRNALNRSGEVELNKFSSYHVKIKNLQMSKPEIMLLNRAIEQIAYTIARANGSRWFNRYAKK